jgi:hypothetical protein
MYELNIAKLFAKIKKYNDVFSSCNKNFKIVKNTESKKWCCDCDKCRFVFLILASFIKKKEMIKIFGENILNNKEQILGYNELVGFSGCKPFECVGEIGESVLAFYLLDNTDYKNDYIVAEILPKIKKIYSIEVLEALKNKYFNLDFKNTLLSKNDLDYDI